MIVRSDDGLGGDPFAVLSPLSVILIVYLLSAFNKFTCPRCVRSCSLATGGLHTFFFFTFWGSLQCSQRLRLDLGMLVVVEFERRFCVVR